MNTPNNDALVVLSGGQDSTTLLYLALVLHETVHAITFDYGQRHVREVEAARRVFRHAQAEYPNRMGEHHLVDLSGTPVLMGTSPLVNNRATLDKYKDADELPGGVEKTFVPMRNPLFLTIAVNHAARLHARHVYTGICEEDFGGYPDCRSDFLRAFSAMTREAMAGVADIELHAPLMHLNKRQTVELAWRLPGAWPALTLTHTCYEGTEVPCGHCHACLIRARGFEQAGRTDPLLGRLAMEGKLQA